MKTIFTNILLSTLILNCYAQEAGEWEILNEGQGYFRLIDFISEDVGFMVGNGNLIKTVDGGDTWNFVSKIFNWGVHDFDFISEFNGWALGSEYHGIYQILKSTDGGYTWQIQKETTDFNYRSMHVVSDSIVFIWEQKLITKTTDAGKNWIDIEVPADTLHYSSIWFFNADSGIVTCGSSGSTSSIFKTFDGGQHWIKTQIPELKNINNLKFINDSTGYFLSSKYFFITIDTLRTWTAYERKYRSYTMFDEKTIIAINTENNLVYSTDAGLTWYNITHPTEGNPYEIVINSLVDIYVISQSGYFSSLWKTSDFGNNWKIQIFSYPFKDLWFFDNLKGVIMGGWAIQCFHCLDTEGNIFVTNDGGKTWKNSFTTGIIEAGYFINDSIGFVSSWEWNNGRNYGTVSKTSDFGLTWSKIYQDSLDYRGYSFTGNDLFFMSNQVGWIVGNFVSADWETHGAGILETRDGGESWELIWSKPNEDYSFTFSSVYSVDSIVWAVGNAGMIVKYTQQDQWQLQSIPTDLPLNKVFFSDEQHGWITGGYANDQDFQSVLFKTTDGGQNWSESKLDKYLINNMYFADSLHGWAVGNDTTDTGQWPLGYGVILETINGGQNWTPVVENLSAPLNAIHFKDGYGWAVGHNGLILRTEDGSTWIDQTTGQKYPSKYQLFQNYPNPFNPITNIKYQIPKSEHVELAIYNILGQKVTTLVNKKQNAGIYDVEWNGSGLTSGLYYYRLKTNEIILTRKLILLK